MLVNQIAVFLENRGGRINDFAKVLSDNGIDLVSMNIADTKEFGILRAVTRDNKKAISVLKKSGFAVTSCDLIGIEVEDKPGGLSNILQLLAANGVDIEYLYSYARTEANKAIILIKVSNIAKAVDVITENKIKLFQENITK